MKFYQEKFGVSIERSNEPTIQLAWNEFWEICRYGERINIKNEVIDFLDDIDTDVQYGQGIYRELFSSEEMINRIVESVRQIRINNETTDEIHDAIEAVLVSWIKG